MLAQEAWKERKDAARKERAKARRERVRRIVELTFDGRSGEEVAKVIGVSIHRLRKIAADHGVTISWRPTAFRRRAVTINHWQERILRRLGEDAGVDPADLLGEIVAIVLEEDANVARELLRIARKEAA